MPDISIGDQFKMMKSAAATKAAVTGGADDSGTGAGAGDPNPQEGKKQGSALPDGQQQQTAGAKVGEPPAGEGANNSGAAGEDKGSASGTAAPANADGAGKTELDLLKQQLQESEARTTALLEQLATSSSTVAPSATPDSGKVDALVITDLITQEEYDAAMDSREGLETILKKVATLSYNSGTEATLKRVPSLVKAEVASAVAVQASVQEFWTANPDMKPYRQVFATIIDDVQKKEPGLTLDALLAKAETQTRERMHLPKKAAVSVATAVAQDPNKQPAFAAGANTRTEAPKTSKIHEEFLLLKGKKRA